MAEDIVARLRAANLKWSSYEMGWAEGMAGKAADTIETLRRELADADERARKKYAPCD